MGWLSGILSGYGDQQDVLRKEAAARDEKAAQTEMAVYNTLINSPDIKQQQMGATGILQMGQGRKRKSGFQGWMGEMESSPIYPVVQKYFATPQTSEEPIPVPHMPSPAGQLPGQPPTSLAQPAASPTQGAAMATPQPQPQPQPQPPANAAAAPPAPPSFQYEALGETEPPVAAAPPPPPPAVASAAALPGAPASAPGAPPAPPAPQTRTVTRYPHFVNAEETAGAAALAKQKADIQADAWMYQQAHPEWTPQEAYLAAAKLAEQKGGRGGTLSSTYIKGGILPDKTSPTGFAMQWVLRSDPTKVMMLPHESSNTPEYAFYKERARRIGTIAQTPEEAWAQARKDNPQGTEEEIATQAQAKWEFSRAMMEQEKRAIPGMGQLPNGPSPVVAPGGPPAPPGGAAAVPTQGTQPNAPVVPVVPDATPTPPDGSGTPDFKKNIAPGYSEVSPRTGKPLVASVQEAVNGARATNDLVDRALATLDPYKDLNSEADGLEMAMNYKKGIEDQLGVAAQLSNLAALQSAATKALSQGGSRAYQFVIDKQQHVPRLPADEQIAKYEVATKYLGMDREEAAKWVSLYYRNKGQPVWDTPKTMIEKLLVVKQNLKDYIRDAMNVDIPEPGPGGTTTPTASKTQAVTAPPPPPASASGAGATTTTPGRIDASSDIIYGPNGATVVGR